MSETAKPASLRVDHVANDDKNDKKLARVYFEMPTSHEDMRFSVVVGYDEWNLKTIIDDALEVLEGLCDNMERDILEMRASQ